jgi:dihydrofolate reductase
MRKLVASFFISLDGVVEGPGPADDFELAGWTMPYWDDQIAAFADVAMSAADTMLLGRVTYQAFEAAFANSMGPDADTMNSYRRFVVSTTLDEATWGEHDHHPRERGRRGGRAQGRRRARHRDQWERHAGSVPVE